MVRKKWDRTAPWIDGCLQHYPETWSQLKVEWKPVEEFEATLTYHSFSRGRSAAYFHLEDENKRLQPMFLAEFGDVVEHLSKGVISGTWTVTKRGQNFGLKLVKPKP